MIRRWVSGGMTPLVSTDGAASLRGSALRLAVVGDPQPERRPRAEAHWTPIVIRSAVAGDATALRWLADLDSASHPAGEMLVAEQAGSLVAAVSLGDGGAIADPFRPTADIVALLRMRADQLQRSAARVAT